MLKRLRIKFVAITMALVATVIVSAFAGIVALEYQHDMGSLRSALEEGLGHRAQTNGDASESARSEARSKAPDEAQAGSGEPSAFLGEAYVPPTIGGGPSAIRFIPVAVCTIDEDGSLIAVSGRGSASIKAEIEEQTALDAASARDGFGFFPDEGLYYLKRTDGENSIVAFADASSASGWKRTAFTAGTTGLVSLAILFMITIFLARWALRPVEAAWKAQQQFVADASHELKTPLTVILANTSILLRHPERRIAEESQWLESTQLEGRRMQSLIGDMLTLAKVESAEMTRPHAPLDFSEMADRHVLQFESMAFEASISLDARIEKGLVVLGNASRLEKMTEILFENACKYAGIGGSVGIRLEKSARGDSLHLSVRNSGEPIPEKDLPHIFDRFYRSDAARTHGENDMSFGLGLAIARSIAREHGGDISVASAKGDGTCFTATLPLPRRA